MSMRNQNLRLIVAIFFISCFFIAESSGQEEKTSNWKSGIELGTGLSFTGYNANLAYTGTFGKNVIFAGPKVVYSDANTLFDTPWGIQLGYRRLFNISSKFLALASVEYQAVLFEYDELETNDLNSIHEFHFAYGLQYFLNDQWSVGNTIGVGGYIERLVDPFDGKVDVFSGFTTHIRIFVGYHFSKS